MKWDIYGNIDKIEEEKEKIINKHFKVKKRIFADFVYEKLSEWDLNIIKFLDEKWYDLRRCSELVFGDLQMIRLLDYYKYNLFRPDLIELCTNKEFNVHHFLLIKYLIDNKVWNETWREIITERGGIIFDMLEVLEYINIHGLTAYLKCFIEVKWKITNSEIYLSWKDNSCFYHEDNAELPKWILEDLPIVGMSGLPIKEMLKLPISPFQCPWCPWFPFIDSGKLYFHFNKPTLFSIKECTSLIEVLWIEAVKEIYNR